MATGRRPTGPRPHVINQPWDFAVQKQFQDWIDSQWESDANGVPAGFKDVDPEEVVITTDPGTETEGWAAADHSHRLGIVESKGSIISHDGTDPTELGVGNDDEVLVADSGETTGLKYQNPSRVPTYVTSVSINTTLDDSYHVVLVDASGGAVTITLPATSTKIDFVVKKTDSSSNYVTVSGNGNNIDGSASFDLEAEDESVIVVGDGSDWQII